jgi:hypothetical protein
VTRNLKEAVSKVPARRTGTAYEAATPGRGGMKIQSPIAIQEGVEVDAAGIWGSLVLVASRGATMGWQKSAEAVVVGLTTQRRAEPDMLSQTTFLTS